MTATPYTMVWTALSVLLLLNAAEGRSSGAPAETCTDNSMTPNHGHAAQIGASPYTVTVSHTQYMAGGSLTVTLSGERQFKGFLVLALPVDNQPGTPLGTFEVVDNSQSGLVRSACTGGATHTSKDLKNNLVLKWNVPSGTSGNVVIYATFVETISIFWVKVMSNVISEGSVLPTDPPQITPISRAACGTDVNCYRDCAGATCDFILKWKKKTATTLKFELFGKLTNSENYVALGLGKEARMADVSIIGCTADGNRVSKVEMFYAASKTSPTKESVGPVDETAANASLSTIFVGKTMSCQFTYDTTIAQANADKWKALDERVYAFIARGPYASGSLRMHTNIPKISPPIDFLSDEFVDIGGPVTPASTPSTDGEKASTVKPPPTTTTGGAPSLAISCVILVAMLFVAL